MWPTVIVLDTTRIMQAFRRHAVESGKPRDFPDEVAAEIVRCLRHARKAAMRLDQFIFAALTNDYEESLNPYLDGTAITFIQELGEYLLNQVVKHNLYDDRGVLHYRYREPRLNDFNCIVLQRSDHGLASTPVQRQTAQIRHF